MGAELAPQPGLWNASAPSSQPGLGSGTAEVQNSSSASSKPSMHRVSPPATHPNAPARRPPRVEKFHRLLSQPSVDLMALRELLWSGAPEEDPFIRAEAWQMLLGYLPNQRERQSQGIAKKRCEYEELKRRHYVVLDDNSGTLGGPDAGNDSVAILRQIRVDIPRTSPGLALFGHPRMQQLLERVLYIWSVRHPASGYVQGINDLATPFIYVLLASELPARGLEDLDLDTVDESALCTVEAGVYWCLTKVLSDIQDHYTAGQPGIQAMVQRLTEIVRRVDETLFRHLEQQGLDFLQFSFRWMNCLLLREFPLPCVVRLWDTYISEPEGFSNFHVYVCAVFLIYWSPQLKQMDFQQLMLFMQKLPTGKWRKREIETLLAEAFVLKSLFHQAPNHLGAARSAGT